MADRTPRPSLLGAQRAARKATLEAELDRIRAEEGDDAPADDEKPAEDPEKPADTTKVEPEAAPEGEKTDAVDDSAAAEALGQARAIAASAEGKANPALALSAIETGLTEAQFKAMSVSAGAGGTKVSPLSAAMSGAKRLPPDATKPAGSSLVSDAKAKAAAAGRR